MKDEFIIKIKTEPNYFENILISYGYISEYEMSDGCIYNYKEIHKSYYNSYKTRNGVLDYYLKRIKEEPENVVRINTFKRNGYIIKTIYHILNNVLTSAINQITINENNVTEENNDYYIDGEILNKEDWKFYNRKHKLKRITKDEVY